MAYVSTNETSFGANVSSALNAMTAGLVSFFSDVRNAGARADMIQELQAMDDATLKAKHGIERGQIVTYVFRDRLLP